LHLEVLPLAKRRFGKEALMPNHSAHQLKGAGLCPSRAAFSIALPSLIAWTMLAAVTVLAGSHLDPAAVNQATYEEGAKKVQGPLAIKLQVLLDRAHISPGLIDGRQGKNVENAIRIFEQRSNLPVDGKLDSGVWELLQRGTKDVLVRYELKVEDLEGPFVETIPTDFAEMARMERLPYSGPMEHLSEKFHVHPDLLKALNPDAQLKAGDQIFVPNVMDAAPKEKVERIEVDKGQSVVRGYAADSTLVVSYPASIGSRENPSPEGTMEVRTTAENPEYAYRPDKNFQQGDNTEPLHLPPGPNGPVGSVWIDLTKETYGIHGTPEPESVGKEVSHGCVRLTNWDAQELAGLVRPGTKVSFVNGSQ
jgi:lipoprotein-anchoring transpeptidase ErfK/SrfK